MTASATPATVGATDDDDVIRQTVRALRAAQQADSAAMALALGISRSSLYNRLNGLSPFLAAELAALSRFFRVPVSDFYNGVVRIGADADAAYRADRDAAASLSRGSSTIGWYSRDKTLRIVENPQVTVLERNKTGVADPAQRLPIADCAPYSDVA